MESMAIQPLHFRCPCPKVQTSARAPSPTRLPARTWAPGPPGVSVGIAGWFVRENPLKIGWFKGYTPVNWKPPLIYRITNNASQESWFWPWPHFLAIWKWMQAAINQWQQLGGRTVSPEKCKKHKSGELHLPVNLQKSLHEKSWDITMFTRKIIKLNGPSLP